MLNRCISPVATFHPKNSFVVLDDGSANEMACWFRMAVFAEAAAAPKISDPVWRNLKNCCRTIFINIFPSWITLFLHLVHCRSRLPDLWTSWRFFVLAFLTLEHLPHASQVVIAESFAHEHFVAKPSLQTFFFLCLAFPKLVLFPLSRSGSRHYVHVCRTMSHRLQLWRAGKISALMKIATASVRAPNQFAAPMDTN